MALSDKTNLLVQPYVRTQYPVLDEGIKRYIQDELQRIESSVRSLSLSFHPGDRRSPRTASKRYGQVCCIPLEPRFRGWPLHL